MAKARSKPRPAPSVGPRRADWDRDQLSVRLTAARRARLREVAASMPAGSTPNQAIDRAIERALRPANDAAKTLEARLRDIDEQTERIANDARRGREEARSAAEATLLQVRQISALMSAVAAGANEAGEDEWTLAPVPFRAWLDAQPQAHGVVVAVGRWRSKARRSGALVSMEFEIAPRGAPGARSGVRLDRLDLVGAFARCDQAAAIHLSCARGPDGGWSVEIRRLAQGGAAGALIGVERV